MLLTTDKEMALHLNPEDVIDDFENSTECKIVF
jgi:hypothetical protein